MARSAMLKGVLALGVLALFGGAAAWPVGGGRAESSCCAGKDKVRPMDLASFSNDPLPEPVDLVFLHHSIGGHLLSDAGPDDGKWHVHPNGGGLRSALTAQGYRVHDATYGSKLGEHTDLFDWLPKLRDHLPEILRIAEQDKQLPEGERNRVVLFKSCFPNNYFEGEGNEPGNPKGPTLTVANAKATLRALLPIFQQHPDTLFVYLTTPPLVGVAGNEPLAKWAAKKLLGKPTASEKLAMQGRLSRQFADWAASSDGWLKDYPLRNVVVFHFYGLLSDRGESNFLRYASGDGTDNHPNATGNQKAVKELVPFLNRAVRRAGIVPTPSAQANSAQ